MTENIPVGENAVVLKSIAPEYSVAPGSSTIIPLSIVNSSEVSGLYRIVVDGIPANWVTTSSPVLTVEAGDTQQLSIIIQPPLRTGTGPGLVPVDVQVINDQDGTRLDSIRLSLTISGYTVRGRIGVMLEATRFTATPGGTVSIGMCLQNHGLLEDELNFSVDGIPISWISTSTPVLKLSPGEQGNVTLTINLPRDSTLPPGPNSFKVLVLSKQAPDQVIEIDCILFLVEQSSFRVSIEPSEIRAGQTGDVVVENKGNTQDSYSVNWISEDEALIFDPPGPVKVQIKAGDFTRVPFIPDQQKRPFYGAEFSYPYKVQVASSENEELESQGVVIGKSLIPFWVVPLILIICLGVVCSSFALYVVQDQSAIGQATPTTEVQESETEIVDGGVIPTNTIPAMQTATLLENPSPTPTHTEIPGVTDTVPLPTATLVPVETPTTTPIIIPDVGRIGFQSNRDGDPELYLKDTGTGTIIRLTQSLGVDTQPVFSPDGNRLAFVSDRTGDNEIYIANADGSNPVNITNSPGIDQNPAWSPDGQWIVFSTNREGDLEIYVMRTDGSELLNLSVSPADDQSPSWIVSGVTQLIAFQSNRDGNQEIYRMNIDGTGQTNLTNNPADDTIPRGATNGTRIAFTTNRDGNAEIYLMSLDGSNPVNLTQNPAADQYPAWSRDSNWIAFITDRDGNQEIYIIRDDGSEFFNITNNPAADLVPDFQ